LDDVNGDHPLDDDPLTQLFRPDEICGYYFERISLPSNFSLELLRVFVTYTRKSTYFGFAFPETPISIGEGLHAVIEVVYTLRDFNSQLKTSQAVYASAALADSDETTDCSDGLDNFTFVAQNHSGQVQYGFPPVFILPTENLFDASGGSVLTTE